MASVTFDQVSKVFPDGTRAVDALSLHVEDGEFMVLVGPSGCGKTTSLRIVAGLEDASGGEVRIGDRVVNELEPRKRDIAMVFQNYALYPHMDARANLSFGLKVRRLPRSEIRARVAQIGGALGLSGLLGRRPGQLSGGQRQRVAMGRAIVRRPQVFLMDEPLSNLDAKLRVQMRAQISRLQRELEATTIYVTHDQVEAMTMGDRVAVLRGGVLQQVDEPQGIYERPVNLFVASFIGSPSMNLVQALVERDNGNLACVVGDQRLVLEEPLPALEAYAGRSIALGIRPEHLTERANGWNGTSLRGSVLLAELLGSEILVHVELEATPVLREEVLEGAIELDEAAVAQLEQEARAHRTTFVGRLDSTSQVRPGDVVDLAVDTRRVHCFDLQTGAAIR